MATAKVFTVVSKRHGDYAKCDDLNNALVIVGALTLTYVKDSGFHHDFWVRDEFGQEYYGIEEVYSISFGIEP